MIDYRYTIADEDAQISDPAGFCRPAEDLDASFQIKGVNLSKSNRMTSSLNSPLFIILFLSILLVVAFLYSSVGHGGASGYLAIMALFSADPAIMKSSALILNVCVSFIAFFTYYRSGFFNWKLFLPFAITSIPASFIGATITLDGSLYKNILGFILVIPILSLLGIRGKEPAGGLKDFQWQFALIIGAVIGLMSGMLGIGGGILLSPVILFLHWAKMKETAAVSALFILVNSVAGIIGLLSKGTGTFNLDIIAPLLVAVTGGVLGSYFGAKKFNNKVLSYILAFVLLIACVKLIQA